MKKYVIIFLSILLLFSVQNSYADEEDAAILLEIEALNEAMAESQAAMEGYELIMKNLQTTMQVDIADQLTALTGTSDLGSFLNKTEEQNARKWSASEWAEIVSGGNGSRYQELLEDYQKAHPTLSTSEASDGMSAENATDYKQQVETNQAASSQATYAFNNTNSHLDTINQLSEKINEETDTKHIQDLTARMNAEIAYLQVEIIKGIAVMNQQMAQQQATEIHDKTEAAKFNKIPE